MWPLSVTTPPYGLTIVSIWIYWEIFPCFIFSFPHPLTCWAKLFNISDMAFSKFATQCNINIAGSAISHRAIFFSKKTVLFSSSQEINIYNTHEKLYLLAGWRRKQKNKLWRFCRFTQGDFPFAPKWPKLCWCNCYGSGSPRNALTNDHSPAQSFIFVAVNVKVW